MDTNLLDLWQYRQGSAAKIKAAIGPPEACTACILFLAGSLRKSQLLSRQNVVCGHTPTGKVLQLQAFDQSQEVQCLAICITRVQYFS